MAHLDVGHFGRHWDEILRHIGVQHLSAVVIKAMLEKRRTKALHDATTDLFVDELGIDDGTAVFDAPMLQQPDETRL